MYLIFFFFFFFYKNAYALLKSHMHIFDVSITTVQNLKNASLWLHKFDNTVYSKYAEKMTKFHYKNVQTFPKIHIFIMSITSVQNLRMSA
jgi:hypothetical protein